MAEPRWGAPDRKFGEHLSGRWNSEAAEDIQRERDARLVFREAAAEQKRLVTMWLVLAIGLIMGLVVGWFVGFQMSH
jgi:hypothetical protein